MKRPRLSAWRSLAWAGMAVAWIAAAPAVRANEWAPFAYISATMGVSESRICIGEASRGEIGCPSYAPSITTTGDVSVTGNLSAARFLGDGSGLTGISTGVSVTTGASGSLVYRDAYGSLVASSGLSISSTTGSVGIGAGAPVNAGNNALYAQGTIYTDSGVRMGSGYSLSWPGGTTGIAGYTSGNSYMTFTTSGTEVMRIVSSGYVGIGTSAPANILDISGTGDQLAVRSTGGKRLLISMKSNGDSYIGDGGSGGGNLYLGAYGYPGVIINPITGLMRAEKAFFGPSSSAGISVSTTFQVSGTIRMSDGGEACDANRLGAMKYTGGAFYICQNTSNGWEPLATTGASANADRITSSSQAGVTANSTGYISLTTGGVTGTAYFTPASVLVNAGVSTTGPISGTNGYFSGNVGIGTSAPVYRLDVSGTSRLGNITVGSCGTNCLGAGGAAINMNANSGSFRFTSEVNALASPVFVFNARTNDSSEFPFQIQRNGTSQLTLNNAGYLGIATAAPSTTLDVSGTIRMADGGEACDTNRKGAIKYTGGDFYVCRNGSAWESLTSVGAGAITDRITSGTTTLLATNGGSLTTTAPLEVSGTIAASGSISASTLHLQDNPPEACTTDNIGALKVIAGRVYTCRM